MVLDAEGDPLDLRDLPVPELGASTLEDRRA